MDQEPTMPLGGEIHGAIRRRQLPIAGRGAGVWSFVHVDDAVAATIAALTAQETGLYNIVDDHPAPVAEWLPETARIIGAKKPRRVPVFLARRAIGSQGVRFTTEIRGSSNDKARHYLGWEPTYASWTHGFREVT